MKGTPACPRACFRNRMSRSSAPATCASICSCPPLCLGMPGRGTLEAAAMATYDEGEAVELLKRTAASMAGNEHHPVRAAAAVALVEALGG